VVSVGGTLVLPLRGPLASVVNEKRVRHQVGSLTGRDQDPERKGQRDSGGRLERGGTVSLQDAVNNARQAKNLAPQVEEQRLGQVLTHLAKAIEELAKALQAQR
jgi:hypothetical protein